MVVFRFKCEVWIYFFVNNFFKNCNIRWVRIEKLLMFVGFSFLVFMVFVCCIVMLDIRLIWLNKKGMN